MLRDPLDNSGGNLREEQLAGFREAVDPRALAGDVRVDALPRTDVTELVR